jgi:hypothetical protein
MIKGGLGVAVLLLLGLAVGAVVREDGSRESGALRALSGKAQASDSGVVGAQVAPTAPDAEAAGAPARVSGQALPPFPDRVVKNADLSVETPKDRFESAWSRAFQIAARFGGNVVSASRGRPTPIPILEGGGVRAPESGDEENGLFGDVTVRVPAPRFEAALVELRKLGKVTGEVTSSSDVTQEFVDLESRLRHLRAEEAVLIRLMGRARSISDTLLVREQLSQVQLQIEELTGRLRYLRSQTDLSTISLHLAEPGAAGAAAGEGPSFAKAWRTALEGLERIGTGVMIAALWVTPFAAVVALAILGVRRLRARPAPQA